MSADDLRAAAALMRSRAEAATPGHWNTDGPWWMGDEEVSMVSGRDRQGITASLPRSHNPNGDADAKHIAGADPTFMLAVAAWLDEAAMRRDVGSDYSDRALDVARAYLRTKQP